LRQSANRTQQQRKFPIWRKLQGSKRLKPLRLQFLKITQVKQEKNHRELSREKQKRHLLKHAQYY